MDHRAGSRDGKQWSSSRYLLKDEPREHADRWDVGSERGCHFAQSERVHGESRLKGISGLGCDKSEQSRLLPQATNKRQLPLTETGETVGRRSLGVDEG